MNYLIILPILLSLVGAAIIRTRKYKSEKSLAYTVVILTSIVSLSIFAVSYFFFGKELVLIDITNILQIGFRIDGLSVVFAVLVSFLWPLATLYATKYMKHEGNMVKFFMYYIITLGVVIGLAFARDMITLYLFYELLTFITLPLVIHNNKERDLHAGRIYIRYSVFGASLSFSGMMIFAYYTGDLTLSANPIINIPENQYLLIAYLLMFIGFSVKAGVVPFHRWLTAAGVAPTPVTALLHAVAVVKSGAFAVMRTTFHLVDLNYFKGTWVQYAIMIFCMISIIIGSSMAMKSKHLKRRFAYSTISQMSYILLAVSTMSKLGLVAALMHLVFHAVIKIVIFYTAGNVIYTTHKDYVGDVEGYGKIMKISFITYTISSLALVGIPPFGGFISKIAIAQSVIEVGGNIGFLGIATLMFSALLTGMYLFQVASLAFIPHNDFDKKRLHHTKEAPKAMIVPMVIITSTMIILSLFSSDLYNFIEKIVVGGI